MVAVLLTATILAGCISARQVPAEPRHLIYLHGRIVQDQQSLRPLHPEYGYYEMAEITAAFRERGFVVSAEMRPQAIPFDEAVGTVVTQVRQLLNSGVPPERITIVGASMGAAIAFRTSARLQNPDIRFALMGPCLSTNAPAVAVEEDSAPAGRLLVIRDESDVPTRDCPAWNGDTERFPQLQAREIVVNTGLGHGFLYRPLPEWFEPVVAWALAKD